MDIGWLQDFLTLADARNFTRAAEMRNSSQAAFSRRMQALEAWLGASLIDRSIFPIELTVEGERFREHASEILGQVLDARLSISQGAISRHDHIAIALPHALATGRFSTWWTDWARDLSLTCDVLPGNVGDAVNSLISGAADILVYYHSPQQPLHLDAQRFEQIDLGVEMLRPYGARELVECGQLALPPEPVNTPVPVLLYGADSYLARMVDLILDANPQKLRRVRAGVSSMSAVLREMVAAGHGIAWLPDAAVVGPVGDRVKAVGDESWAMPLSVMAYRERDHEKPAVQRLWAQMKEQHEPGAKRRATTPIRVANAPKKTLATAPGAASKNRRIAAALHTFSLQQAED